jgi:hypothetical protein
MSENREILLTSVFLIVNSSLKNFGCYTLFNSNEIIKVNLYSFGLVWLTLKIMFLEKHEIGITHKDFEKIKPYINKEILT